MSAGKSAAAGGATPVPSVGARLTNGALAATVVVVLSAAVARLLLNLELSAVAILLDLLAWLPLALGIALAARHRAQPWVAMLMLAAVLVIGNAYKVAMMGAPLLTADVGNGFVLLRVLPGWRWALAWFLLLAWAVLLAWAWLPARRRAAWLLLPAAWLAGLVLAAPPIDQAFANLEGEDAPVSIERLQRHGVVAFLLRDGVARDQSRRRVPARSEVREALQSLGVAPRPAPAQAPGPQRNLHAFLLESVWDVTQLDAYQFSGDPFDPRFREAWRQGGNSTILSPAFGGATANAEFEFLCGLPALRDAVTFEVGLARPMPCLPRVLREAGYHAAAVHPYHADFWSRDRAYPLVGFETYRPIDSFALQDMDGMFLADESTYAQLRDWLSEPGDGRPRFTYTVSLSAHYPYDRDRARRPDLVSVTPGAPMLEGYANAARYATAAFMDHAEAILAQDPDALVVAFGDHAPVLGVDPDPYLASGLDMRGAAKRIDDTYPRIASTPLLVIDGRRGVVPMGEVPLHRLAPKVLALLGEGAPVLPHAPHADEDADDTSRTRLFFSHLLARRGDGGWQVCNRNDARCARSFEIRDSLATLRDDLMQGEQHSLALLDARRFGQSVETRVEAEFAACTLAVEAWGPGRTRQGEGFNVQPNGGSAFWFKLSEARGSPRIEVGGQVVETFLAGHSGSANFGRPAFIDTPGSYPVRWTCEDGSSGDIGEFVVEAPPAAPAEAVATPTAAAADVAVEAGCLLSVEDWGPRTSAAGQGFNLQANGNSALWFRFGDVQGEPVLTVDGVATPITRNGLRGSAGFAPTSSLVQSPGSHALGWQCPDGTSGDIGVFTTKAPQGAAPQ